MTGPTENRYSFEPDYTVLPGETLLETIESLGMTQRDLSARTGLAPKTINQIIKGKAPITPDTAILLELVTGVPARLWNNLESNYREQMAKIADRKRVEADLEWLKGIPVKELVNRGVIRNTKENSALVYSVLRFFGVAGSRQWREIWMDPDCAFRKSPRFRAEPGAVATWLRLGELEAQKLSTPPYDVKRFTAALNQIKSITVEDPAVFVPKMVEYSASAGVAVVFIPEIKKCPVSGAARWLTPEKALIQLSLRYKTDDHFWFSFFHEAGHILKDPKKEVFIHDGEGDGREVKANRFAANFLIPPEHGDKLPGLRNEAAIRDFAQTIGLAPGVVLGRLQKEGFIPWATRLNRLKRHFEWTQNIRV